MKKKRLRLLIILFAIGIFILYTITKTTTLSFDAENIGRIEIFDGTRGEGVTIEEDEEIQEFVEHFDGIALKKKSISLFRLGYGYKITIYTKEGKSGGWNQFIINSTDLIRKDPFFYEPANGSIDKDYIDALFGKE